MVGLEFLSEHPPAGYLDKPWTTFRTTKWTGTERRRQPREYRAEVVWVEYFTDSMQSITQQAGITESLSRGGARICVKGAPPEFDLVKITSQDHSFESLAAVTDQYVGKEGFERICVQFIEREWPI